MLAHNDNTTDEVQTRIFHANGFLDFTNLYVPPIRTSPSDDRVQNFDPYALPRSRNDVICGDVNAHGHWDLCRTDDELGRKIENWMDDRNIAVLNSGEPTHEAGTSPDVSIVEASRLDEATWSVHPEVDDVTSDHMPITIEWSLQKVSRVEKRSSKLKWNVSKAKWDVFEDILAQQLENWVENASVKEMNSKLQEAILYAAKRAIPRGKGVDRKQCKQWWSEEIGKAIKERNKAARKKHQSDEDRAKWLELRTGTRNLIAEAKLTAWRNFASTLNARSDSRHVWKIIRSLSGKNRQDPSGAALIRGEKVLVSAKEKANGFVKEYAAVSHSTKRNKELPKKKRVYGAVNTAASNEEEDRPFTMGELKAAVRKMRSDGAPGVDGVLNATLKHLGARGRECLLQLMNKSWLLSEVPRSWRKAKIVPVPKTGKPAELLGSYRPISLTSVVSKCFERMIKERLMHWLEKNKKLNKFQSGFRKQHSTEDQIIRIAQKIADGMNQRKPPKRSVMVLIDFARAFDTVPHVGILSKLTELGTPSKIVKWTKSFLEDRRSCVEFENATSKYRRMQNGVPQGAVISPALFLVFINDILEELSEDVDASLFADDLALIVSDQNKERATKKMQTALTAIENWASNWSMQISVPKSEVTFFTNDPSESNYRPQVTLLGQHLQYQEHPVFLGVTFDQKLTFRKHVETLVKNLKIRSNVLKAIAGKDWGCCKEDLRLIFNGFIVSKAFYAAPAWMPSTAKTNLDQVQRVQSSCCRTITGANRSTPIGPLNWEAGVMPIDEKAKMHVQLAWEKAARKDPDNPLREVINEPHHQRLKRRSFATVAAECVATSMTKTLTREPLLPVATFPPWAEPENVEFHTKLKQKCKRSDDPAIKKRIAEDTIKALPPPDLEMWCDGSAERANENGGSGVLVIDNINETRHEIMKAAGRISSSYRAELTAMLAAVTWLRDNWCDEWKVVLMCSDSKSLIERLQSGPTDAASLREAELWKCLGDINILGHPRIILQWVPGHCELEGNEAADILAKRATKLPQTTSAIDFKTVSATVKRECWTRCRKGTYHDSYPLSGAPPPTNPDLEKSLTRKQRCIMSQLRAGGHCTIFQAYRFRIGQSDTPECKRCGDPEDDMEHCLLQCPALDVHRLRTLGANIGIQVNNKRPADVINFLQCAGLLPREAVPRHQ